VIVIVVEPIKTRPTRVALVPFTSVIIVIDLFPVPLAPSGKESQLTSLVAVQLHPAGADTFVGKNQKLGSTHQLAGEAVAEQV
jgi:hypothetical protein